MRKLFVLVLGIALSIQASSQEVSLFLRLKPQVGAIERSQFYSRTQVDRVGMNYEEFLLLDEVDENGDSLTYYGLVYQGTKLNQKIAPYMSLEFGLKSCSRLYYEFTLGVQFNKVSYESTWGYFSDNGLVDGYFTNWGSSYESFPSPPEFNYSEDNELVFNFEGRSQMKTIGSRNGLALAPTFNIGVGYRVTPKNAALLQANLWMYGLAFQHEREKFDIGLGAGMYYLSLADRFKIGPWLEKGSIQYDWLQSTQALNVSAYLNVKLSRSPEKQGVRAGANPQEF
jgi:hypothetical protein